MLTTITKTKTKIRPTKVAVYLVLILTCLVMLMPLIVLIATSFRTYEDLMLFPSAIFPQKFTLESYFKVLKDNPYFRYLGNTLIIAVVSIVGTCLTSAMVGYGFTRFKVRGAGLIFSAFLSGMLIPGQVLTIPMFELYQKFGWVNTFFPFLIPVWFGGGIFNVFLQRQFMRGIPSSLLEAAEVDGASEVRIFLTLMVPLSIPVLVTIAVFTFMNSWNDLFGPLLYLDSQSMWTLAKGNYMIYKDELGKVGASGGSILPWNIISAANMIAILPIVVLYFFAQRVFVEGIVTTGIKE